MFAIRTIAVALTLLAVVTNPVVAMAVPCCCKTPVKQQEKCCTSNRQSPAIAATPKRSCCEKEQHHACCVQGQQSEERLLPGCCCVKSTPVATILPERLVRSTVEKQFLEFTFSFQDRTYDSPITCWVDQSPERYSLSGTSLLAFYCRWLI